MKRRAAVLASVAAMALMAASPAQADLIPFDNGNSGYYLFASPLGSPSDEAAWIASVTGADVTYLNKFNYGSTGGFDNTGAVGSASFDPGGSAKGTEKTISWNLTGTGYEASYVLIKNGTVGGHLYRLYMVTDDQAISGSGTVTFGPIYPSKQISHVGWFGSGATSVPDGGTTLLLLGSALVGLGALRRRVGP
jgi:hypothetical protein